MFGQYALRHAYLHEILDQNQKAHDSTKASMVARPKTRCEGVVTRACVLSYSLGAQFTIDQRAKESMGEQNMQEIVECLTTDFPPRPNLTEPDWWHVWKPLQDDVDQQQQDHPRCLMIIEFVEDTTCATLGK